MGCIVLCAAGVVATGGVRAQTAEENALSIADKAKSGEDRARIWHAFVEVVGMAQSQRIPVNDEYEGRASGDLRIDDRLTPELRFVFADRFDVLHQFGSAPDSNVNTLKEAYLSWQPSTQWVLDAGRINLRQGVATGYNPTDFFRTNAVRTVVSASPDSLRQNRLGTVVLQGKRLWPTGSFSALFAPHIGNGPSSAGASPDFGATNAHSRYQLAISQRLSERLQPQLLVYGGEAQSPTVGVNVSALVSNAATAFFEWSGGRGQALIDQALGRSGADAFRSRAASGLTYTTSFNLTFTLEYEYNGAAPDRAQWNALQAAGPRLPLAYLQGVQPAQDLATRSAWFLFALWQDAGIKHLDLSAFARIDREKKDRMVWAEARYHFTHSDLALQWQLQTGAQGTLFGAPAQRRLIEAVFRQYL